MRTLAFDGDDAYYGGPDGAGRVVSGLPERTFTSENGLVSDDVRTVATRSGKAWFGTDQGVSEFDVQRNDLLTVNAGLLDLDVRALAVAGGSLYAGTSTGVWVLDESVPAAPVWQVVNPPINAEIVDLVGEGDRLAVLGTGRRVWVRDDPALPWNYLLNGEEDHRYYAITLDALDSIQLGGRRFDAAPIGNDVTPLFADLQGNASPYYRQLYGTEFRGLEPDPEGGVWIGAFPVDGALTHWRADGSVVAYTAEETGDPEGVLNNDGWLENLKIDIHRTSDGALWVSSFQLGITRFVPGPDGNPAASTFEHFLPANSPLDIERVYSIAEDPHGNLWFCAAGELVIGDFNAGIDILTDPQAPNDPNSWLHLRTSNSLLAGVGLNRISFEGDRAVWLTVRDFGLQRFEYGDGSGIDPARFTDGASWRNITALPELATDNLTSATQVTVSPAGRVWVATDGEGLFSFQSVPEGIVSVNRYAVDAIGMRLLSDSVYSVDVAADGSAWAATALGLTRIVESPDQIQATSYTDLQTLLDFDLGDVISQRALRSLAGGIPTGLEVSPTNPLLFAVSSRGVTRVDLTGGGGGGTEEGPAFSIYPNPVHAGDDLILEGFEGEATVEIYDLQGRPLRRTTVEAGESVWRLETLSGEPVANGMYMVRMTQNGRSSIRVLAVER